MTFSQWGLTGYQVQYWNGTTWVTIPGASVSGNNNVWRKFSFSPITTSKIRVLTNASADGYSRLAEIEAWGIDASAAAKVHWIVTDQLGTPRMVFDQTGNLSGVSRHDYLPFGEELFAGGRSTTLGFTNDDGTRQRLTGKIRDVESGLDYFGARYYSSRTGRWTGADLPLVDQEIDAPESWNLYSYCRNNPLRFYDDDGRKVESIVVRYSPSDPNKVDKKTSRQITDGQNLGAKEWGKQGNGWYQLINVEAQLSAGDNPKDYKPYVWVLPKQQSVYGQRADAWSNDTPGNEYVTRGPNSIVFSDNPGLELARGPAIDAGAQKPATFSALYAAAVVPKGTSNGDTAPWKLPADTKIVLYQVEITVVKGKAIVSKVTAVGTITAGDWAKSIAAQQRQKKAAP